MSGVNFFKAFVSGLAFPAIALPLAYSVFVLNNPDFLPLLLPIYLYPMFIPLFFGIANVAYLRLGKQFRKKHDSFALLLTGAVLGLIVYWLKISTFVVLFFTRQEQHSVFILPIVYALIFRFIVKHINKMYNL